jgi:hypothetical protein
MAEDGLSAHCIQAKDLDDVPAAGFRVGTRALLVVLGTFSTDLVLGGDPDPYADALIGI